MTLEKCTQKCQQKENCVGRFLKKYQQLCPLDPRLRNEELPPISDVSDDEVFQEPIFFMEIEEVCSTQGQMLTKRTLLYTL